MTEKLIIYYCLVLKMYPLLKEAVLEPIPEKMDDDEWVLSRAKEEEVKGYIDACRSMGEALFDIVESSERALVVVPLRGSYPITMGAMSSFSDLCERERDVADKMTLLYLPGSISKPREKAIFENQLGKVDAERYDSVVVMDEFKSGSSLKGISEIAYEKLDICEERRLMLLAMSEDVKGDTRKHQRNSSAAISECDYTELTEYSVPRILTLDYENQRNRRFASGALSRFESKNKRGEEGYITITSHIPFDLYIKQGWVADLEKNERPFWLEESRENGERKESPCRQTPTWVRGNMKTEKIKFQPGYNFTDHLDRRFVNYVQKMVKGIQIRSD